MGGTEAHHKLTEEIAEELPDGPTEAELFSYSEYLSRVAYGDMKNLFFQRTCALLQDGGVLVTDYTCRQSAELLFSLAEVQWAKMGFLAGWLTLYRGSEPLQHLQQLMAMGGLKSMHVYPDVQSVHLNDRHQAAVAKLKAPIGASEDEIMQANAQIDEDLP